MFKMINPELTIFFKLSTISGGNIYQILNNLYIT